MLCHPWASNISGNILAICELPIKTAILVFKFVDLDFPTERNILLTELHFLILVIFHCAGAEIAIFLLLVRNVILPFSQRHRFHV